MNDLIFCIITCKNFKARQEALKETWLKNQKYIFLSDEEKEDSLNITEIQGHASGEIKQLDSFKHIKNKKLDYNWYFFCDDDTFVNVKNLRELIFKLSPFLSYGNILSFERDPLNPCWNKYGTNLRYLSGGSGFFISNSTLNILANKDMSPQSGYGDLTLGLYMKKFMLDINHIDGLYKDKPEAFNHSLEQIKNAYTYHYIKPEEMIKLSKIL
jgi:hypothetical protein